MVKGASSTQARNDDELSKQPNVPRNEPANNSDKRSSCPTLGVARRKFIATVADLSNPLQLRPIHGDFAVTASALPFNALCLETRDMFRITYVLEQKAKESILTVDDLRAFYTWFEGFYSVLTSTFEVQEHVLFPWLEKIGAIEMDTALAPKRRKVKQERTKDVCWDILELKIQLQNKPGRAVRPNEIVVELIDEVQLLASRVILYFATVDEELPSILKQQFGNVEREMIESAVFNNLRATEQGQFALTAYARSISEAKGREDFLVKVFRTPTAKQKSVRPLGIKMYKRFISNHVDIADQLYRYLLELR